jgi:hypothetical protein
MRNLHLASFNRWQAAATHLVLSAVVASTVFALIFLLWFPSGLFVAAGGLGLLFLIVGVDVTLGPTLTLIVFDPHKDRKKLRFDLAIIGTLQFVALCYGVWVLSEARPAFITFVQDRFELVRANDIAPEAYAMARDAQFDHAPYTGPVVAGTTLPKDPAEQLSLAQSVMQGGQDVQALPRYYVPYAQVRDQAIAHGQSIAKLRELNPGRDAEIDALLANQGRNPGEALFLPLRAGPVDLTILIDARDGTVLRTAALQPWRTEATAAPKAAPGAAGDAAKAGKEAK